MKSYIAEINDGFPDLLLSYSDNAIPNALDLKHELCGCDLRITLDAESAMIS